MEIHELPESTFSPQTMRVLANMGEKMLSVQLPFPTEQDTEATLIARRKTYQENLAEMARSLGAVLKYVATPGIRLWPDNGREDCLSLSGSLHQLSFGIIWTPNADGTGTWTFHS